MSTSANSHYLKAAAFHREGLAPAAITELKQAIVLDPQYIRGYLALAAIYEARNDSARAMAVYHEVDRRDPGNAPANLRLGILLNSLGRHDEALEPLNTSWSSDCGNAKTASALAKAMQATGDLENAELMYEEAIRLDQGLTGPLYNLAALRFNGGHYESAIELFTAFTEKAGEGYRAYRNIGKAYVYLGDADSAIQNFNKALTLAPDEATVHYNLARALTLKGDFAAAAKSYNRAVTIRPDYIEARYHLSKSLRKTGKVKAAEAELDSALAQSPEYCRVMDGLGNFHTKPRTAQATTVETLLRAVGMAPDYTQAHYDAGVALQNMDKLEDACYHFRESLRLNPEFKLAKSGVDEVMKLLGINPNGSDLMPSDQKRSFQTA